MIENKPRRALDLVSISVEPEQIIISSTNGKALEGVKDYMKMKRDLTKSLKTLN